MIENLLYLLANPHYVYKEQDTLPYANNFPLFHEILDNIESFISLPRTREHLWFYRALLFSNSTIDLTNYDNSEKLFCFRTLIHLNYTLSEREHQQATLILKKHSRFKAFFVIKSILRYPNLLLQPVRRHRTINGELTKISAHNEIRLYSDITPLSFSEKNMRAYEKFLKRLDIFYYNHTMIHLFAQYNGNENIKNFLLESFPFLQNPRSVLETLLQKVLYGNSYRNVCDYYISNYPDICKEILLKKVPQLETFSFALENGNLSSVVWTTVNTSLAKHYKLTEFSNEKDFLTEHFGMHSSRLSSFVKTLPENYKSRPDKYLKNLMIMGLMVKTLNLSHNYAWKLLEYLQNSEFSLENLLEDHKLVSYLEFLNFLSEDQRVRFIINSFEALSERPYNLQDYLYEDSENFVQNKEYFLNFFKEMSFSEYNNALKIHHLVQREVNKIKQPAFSFYFNNLFPVSLFPTKIKDFDVVLPKNTEELIQWGFELKNCLGSYLQMNRRDRQEMAIIVGFKQAGKLVYALELDFTALSEFKRRLLKLEQEPGDHELNKFFTFVTTSWEQTHNYYCAFEEFRGAYNESPMFLGREDLLMGFAPFLQELRIRHRDLFLSKALDLKQDFEIKSNKPVDLGKIPPPQKESPSTPAIGITAPVPTNLNPSRNFLSRFFRF